MSDFDRGSWERRWAKALEQRPGNAAQRPPNVHLRAVAEPLQPGLALDAGCGHGSDTLWLAARGWRVTAVDFSATALAHGRASTEELELADRVDWVEGDLATWTPEPGRFDLVTCLYVHVAGSVGELVTRMAGGVAPGGTLLLVGHRPIDPETGGETPAAGQTQVDVETAVAALDGWELVVAEERRRATAGTGVDAVIAARRRA